MCISMLIQQPKPVFLSSTFKQNIEESKEGRNKGVGKVDDKNKYCWGRVRGESSASVRGLGEEGRERRCINKY